MTIHQLFIVLALLSDREGSIGVDSLSEQISPSKIMLFNKTIKSHFFKSLRDYEGVYFSGVVFTDALILFDCTNDADGKYELPLDYNLNIL